jgi:hypothetical protein
MDEEKALLPAEEGIPAGETRPMSYWARVARIYQYVGRGLVVSLILFVVLFAVLSPAAFSYDGLRYFAEDLGAAVAIADGDSPVLCYTYGEEASTYLAYHGGVALAHTKGVEIYQADGQRSLFVSLRMKAPRLAASRNYLVAFDIGGTDFSVCNSYAELYRGKTEFPIYDVQVTDAGYFAVITASDKALSQVLLYDGGFSLIQRFYRSSATVKAAVSDSGRYVALLGLTAKGGVLDTFVLGDTAPLSTVRFDGELPLALGFTSATTLSAVTDRALYPLHVDGRHYGAVSFSGARPVRYEIRREGALVVLETDAVLGHSRVLSLDKRGRTVTDAALTAAVKGISTFDGTAFVLTEDTLFVYTSGAQAPVTYAVGKNALGLSAVGKNDAYVFYGAQAVKYSVVN